jgi:hypothetical protein
MLESFTAAPVFLELDIWYSLRESQWTCRYFRQSTSSFLAKGQQANLLCGEKERLIICQGADLSWYTLWSGLYQSLIPLLKRQAIFETQIQVLVLRLGYTA